MTYQQPVRLDNIISLKSKKTPFQQSRMNNIIGSCIEAFQKFVNRCE